MWTDRFSTALADRSGMPRDVTDLIAPVVSKPKDYLQRKNGEFVLAPEALGHTDTGEETITVKVHGFVGNAGEYNERINSFFAAPFQPHLNGRLVRPRLATGRTSSGTFAPFITTADPVGHDDVNALLGVMTRALLEVNADRTYDLREDLEVHGQQQATTHVALLRLISEPDGKGGTRIRELVDLTAVQGANRTVARLDLFGLTPADVVFGVRPRTVLGVGPKVGRETRVADPRRWVPQLADLLREAFADPTHPGHDLARRASKLATVQMRIIIGAAKTGSVEDFHSAVFDANRTDHRRPPLEYRVGDRSAADFRALLRDYKQHGLIDEPTRAWLAGEGPDPAARAGESIIDARDRRDRALLTVVFPADDLDSGVSRWQRARIVLGEPSRTRTTSKHVNARARMYSAAASDFYGRRWNPRVMDSVFPAKSIKDRISYTELAPWHDVRAAAEAGDFSLLEEFIQTRGIHWLVDAGLVEADRGSVGAQTAADEEEDDDIREQLERRSVANVRAALILKPVAAFGLLLELAYAAEQNTTPRRVDESGAPEAETKATKLWLQHTFPKRTGRGSRNKPGGLPPENPPAEPAPDPQSIRLVAQTKFEQAITVDVIGAVSDVFDRAGDLVIAAEAAGMLPLATATEPTVETIEKALIAIGEDIETLVRKLTRLKHGKATSEDFAQSHAALYAEEVAE
ncbi:hypothetical protein ACWEVP_35855 [Amycolatopsis sp. NPDC003865]